MPIPTPREDEEKEEFISRCMGDDTMVDEYPDAKQRAAICYQSWDDSKKIITPEEIANAEIVDLTEEKATPSQPEYKSLRFQVKEFDEDTWEFEGIASAYRKTPDKYGDIVDPGAFSKTIKENNGEVMLTFPPHDILSPVGVGLMTDTPKGLKVKGKLIKGVQKAQEAYLLLKSNLIKTLSIGYEAVKTRLEGNVRHLAEVKIIEIGLIPGKFLAADDQAVITSVKSIEPIVERIVERKFQALLQDKAQEPPSGTPASVPGGAAVPQEPPSGTPQEMEALNKTIDDVLSRFQSLNEEKAAERLDEIIRNFGG